MMRRRGAIQLFEDCRHGDRLAPPVGFGEGTAAGGAPVAGTIGLLMRVRLFGMAWRGAT
jgi:hypothetical protein